MKIGAGKGIDLPDRLSLHPPAPLDTRGLAAAVRDGDRRPVRPAPVSRARRPPRAPGAAARRRAGGRHPRRRRPGRGHGARRARDAGHACCRSRGRPAPARPTSPRGRSSRWSRPGGGSPSPRPATRRSRNLLRACLAALPDDATGLTIENVALAHKIGDGDDPYDAGVRRSHAVAPANDAARWRERRRGRRHRLPFLPAGVRGRLRHAGRRRGGAGRARQPAGHGALRPQHRARRRPAPAAAGGAGRASRRRRPLLPRLAARRARHRAARPRHPAAGHPADASRPLPLRLGAGLRGPAVEPPRHRPPARRRHPLAGGRRASRRGAARRQRPGRARGDRGDPRRHRRADRRHLDRPRRRHPAAARGATSSSSPPTTPR